MLPVGPHASPVLPWRGQSLASVWGPLSVCLLCPVSAKHLIALRGFNNCRGRPAGRPASQPQLSLSVSRGRGGVTTGRGGRPRLAGEISVTPRPRGPGAPIMHVGSASASARALDPRRTQCRGRRTREIDPVVVLYVRYAIRVGVCTTTLLYVHAHVRIVYLYWRHRSSVVVHAVHVFTPAQDHWWSSQSPIRQHSRRRYS